ncbi:MAG: DUF5615 family PIN-like protein [Candidatus Hydrogenedentes bacterium]|nr:DUF5615 family PIN-like protein [Candidatus Hydrogenedentota bacterium]
MLSVRETDRGASDTDVLRMAAESDRVLLTAGKDFGDLVFRQGRGAAGIILLRLRTVSRQESSILSSSILPPWNARRPDTSSQPPAAPCAYARCCRAMTGNRRLSRTGPLPCGDHSSYGHYPQENGRHASPTPPMFRRVHVSPPDRILRDVRGLLRQHLVALDKRRMRPFLPDLVSGAQGGGQDNTKQSFSEKCVPKCNFGTS